MWAFVLGVIPVTSGVLLHLPMFLMGRMTHFQLYGMPMGVGMYSGMGAIILGVAIAAYGFCPRTSPASLPHRRTSSFRRPRTRR